MTIHIIKDTRKTTRKKKTSKANYNAGSANES
jgi:hypothetical protein